MIYFSWKSQSVVVIEVAYSGLKSSGDITFSDSVKMNDWLFLSVRVHINERLIRFGINRKDFAHDELRPLSKFSTDGELRLAQRIRRRSENIPEIANRFLVSEEYFIALL